MENNQLDLISVIVTINQSLDLVWETWNDETQMKHWAFTTPEYEVRNAKNDLKIGGGYSYEMVSKESDVAFQYAGTYTQIDLNQFISFVLNDGRKVDIEFSLIEDLVYLKLQFEPVLEQDLDVQQEGWQNILNNFKNYVESIPI